MQKDPLAGFDLSFDLEDLESALDAGLSTEPPESIKHITAVDIGAYDTIDVGRHGDTINYARAFLYHSREPFYASGLGDYSCVLRWPHSRVNDEDVRRVIQAFRALISRLRAETPDTPNFVVALIDYKILEDNKHVFVQCARMRPAVYEDYMRLKREAAQPRSALHSIKDLM